MSSTSSTALPSRRRSRSDGSPRAAALVRSNLEATMEPQSDKRSRATVRFAVSELYTRTKHGVVFKDEDFQRESVAKAERLAEIAHSPDSSERNALIAQKALRYRRMRSRRPGASMSGMEDRVLRTQSCPAANFS